MYAHSIPDFVLTLTNEPRYFGRIFKTNGPIKQPLFKKTSPSLSLLVEASGIDAKVHITRQIQKRYIANNGIQLWDLLCMARMANSRMIESKTVLFKIPVTQNQTGKLMYETLQLKCTRNFFRKKKIKIMLPSEN